MCLADYFRCFTKYPNGIHDWLKSTFPDGYSVDRRIYFDNDGMLKSYHEVTFTNGIVRSRVNVTGEGFREDGDVINGYLGELLPSVTHVIPLLRGLRSVGYYVSSILISLMHHASVDLYN